MITDERHRLPRPRRAVPSLLPLVCSGAILARMDIASQIQARRRALGWTQSDLARRLGLSERYGFAQVSHWEARVSQPTVRSLRRLADAFGCTLDELSAGNHTGNPPVRLGDPPRMDGEEWRPVVGYEERYMVSNRGRVWARRRVEYDKRLRGGYIVTPLIQQRRARVALHGDGRVRKWSVCHLVLMSFVGLPPGEIGLHDHQYSCNHKNGDPTDNRPENLEWLLNPEHRAHTVDNQLHARRESHPKARLTWGEVRQIRARPHASGPALAKEYGVSRSAIYAIRKGETWKED